MTGIDRQHSETACDGKADGGDRHFGAPGIGDFRRASQRPGGTAIITGTAIIAGYHHHHHNWNGGYYPAPPVVYGFPYGASYLWLAYYYPPPVVYGPSVGVALPGLNIGIR